MPFKYPNSFCFFAESSVFRIGHYGPHNSLTGKTKSSPEKFKNEEYTRRPRDPRRLEL